MCRAAATAASAREHRGFFALAYGGPSVSISVQPLGLESDMSRLAVERRGWRMCEVHKQPGWSRLDLNVRVAGQLSISAVSQLPQSLLCT